MQWLNASSELLGGMILLALTVPVTRGFRRSPDDAKPLTSFDLVVVPMTALLIIVGGLVLLFMGAGIL